MYAMSTSLWSRAWARIFHQEMSGLKLLTGFEQTRLSWARKVSSYEEAPEAFRDSLRALVGETTPFPYAVLTPTFEGFRRRENEKLVCSYNARVYVLEKTKSQVTTTYYAPEDIHLLEMGEILLDSWIRISGLASSREPMNSLFRFNTVTGYLFTPIVQQVRAAAQKTAEGDLDSERTKFDYLEKLDYKFMNFGRRSILPGERVIATFLQPDIYAEMPALLARFARLVSPVHLSILTDQELILIKDDITVRRIDKNIRHGGIWNYIQLSKITSVSLTEKNARLLVLTIRLREDEYVDSLFAVSNRPQVDAFVNQLKNSISTSNS